MSKLLNCLLKKDQTHVPIWFMRQAGRYLPEFRSIRAKNPNFMELCFNSDLASTITLQPLQRFDLDAAIIFSDILVIPYALGQEVKFKANEGPILSEINLNKFLDTSKKDFLNKLSPIYEAIRKTKKELKKGKTLISFVGAPWTLLTYIYNLKKNNTKQNTFYDNNKKNIDYIFQKLDEFLKYHIEEQTNAGADVIQIFDSWAGLINETNINKLCYEPNRSLVAFCKKKGIPTVCFPKGLQTNYKKFVQIVKPDGINIDYNIDPLWAKENLGNICIQGGMHPDILLKDKKLLLNEVEKYVRIFENNFYIFNLGHGILPQTNPEIIKEIIKKVKAVKK